MRVELFNEEGNMIEKPSFTLPMDIKDLLRQMRLKKLEDFSKKTSRELRDHCGSRVLKLVRDLMKEENLTLRDE